MNARVLLVVVALVAVLSVFAGVSNAAAPPPWHHHHGGWYPYSPIVVGPSVYPPAIQPPVVVVSRPILVANPPPVLTSIQIVNPSGVTLSYSLNGRPVSLAAGMTQELVRVSVIEFDRGNGSGAARYTLTDGVYRFVAGTDGGWDLGRN